MIVNYVNSSESLSRTIYTILKYNRILIEKVVLLFSLGLCFASFMIPHIKVLRIIGLFGLFFISLPSIYSLRINKSLYNKWFFAFALFSLFSTLWALNPYASIWGVQQIIPLWFINISIINYVGKNLNKLYDVFFVFFISTVILLLYTVLYFDFSQFGNERLSDTQEGFNGNSIAIAFTCSIFIVISLFKSNYLNIFVKPFVLVLSIAMFAIILLTGSRTSLLMLVFPLSVFFFLKSKYKVNAIIGIAILFVLSFVLITKVPYFYNVLGVRVFDMFEIIKQGQDFSGGADNSRFLLFIYGFEWFQESPAIGSGINNYRVLSNITPPFVGRNFYAHSNIIEMLVGVGIVGTIIYYSIIYFLIRRAKSINSAYYKVVITIGLTFLFHDIFSMSYYEYEMQLLLCTSYILIGLKKENNK